MLQAQTQPWHQGVPTEIDSNQNLWQISLKGDPFQSPWPTGFRNEAWEPSYCSEEQEETCQGPFSTRKIRHGQRCTFVSKAGEGIGSYAHKSTQPKHISSQRDRLIGCKFQIAPTEPSQLVAEHLNDVVDIVSNGSLINDFTKTRPESPHAHRVPYHVINSHHDGPSYRL